MSIVGERACDACLVSKTMAEYRGRRICITCCNEDARLRARARREANPEEESAKRKKYYNKNKEREKAVHKEYLAYNKYAVAVQARIWYEANPDYRLASTLRKRLYKVVRGGAKTGSAIKALGCTVSELRKHLESGFYSDPRTGTSMSWENHGTWGWHIDHIRPLASFDLQDPTQLAQACHYTNLQPMWWWQNLIKGAKYE